MMVGADGPCKIAVNVGGKMFRSHHDEVNKGLIDGGNMKDMSKDASK